MSENADTTAPEDTTDDQLTENDVTDRIDPDEPLIIDPTAEIEPFDDGVLEIKPLVMFDTPEDHDLNFAPVIEEVEPAAPKGESPWPTSLLPI